MQVPSTCTYFQQGKTAFSPEASLLVEYFIVEKVIAFVLMLNFNKYMFQFLFRSFQENGSAVTVVISFLSNNLLNV
jgi:hypothetical protein